MQPYFVWNGVDSRAMGVIVSSYPPIIRPAERVIQQTIPGRAGALIQTEGADIYDAYVRTFVIGVRPGADSQRIANWLRGPGVAVFGNEPEYRYFGRILAAVQFDKVGSWRLKSAGVQMLTQPYKGKSPREPDISISSASFSLYNPGDVASRPIIQLSGGGNITLTLGGVSMAFSDAPSLLRIDCDAQIITQADGTLWTGSWTGKFPSIPTGTSTGSVSGGAELTITPEWRWL